jgi:hypothetical protein
MLIALRVFFGVLALAAIGKQFSVQAQMGFSIVNFFSYFTNLSNIFAAIVLIWGAFQLMTHRQPSPSTDLLRGMAVVNMAIVGIVFSALLRDVDMGYLLPWVNTVLHYIMPIVVVLEWLFQPPTTKLGVKHLLWCQVFPLLYLVYTLTRGAIVGWYPYPFLTPANVGGYSGVAAYAVGIIIVFVLAAGLLFTLGNRLNKKVRVASSSSPS